MNETIRRRLLRSGTRTDIPVYNLGFVSKGGEGVYRLSIIELSNTKGLNGRLDGVDRYSR